MLPDSSIFEQLPQILGGILALDSETYAALHTLPGAGPLARLIILVAGFSEAAGQVIILFINRVRPRQFVPALLSVAFSFSVGLAVWFVSTWLIAMWGFGQDLTWFALARALSFACLPLTLLFFSAAPYFGVPAFVLLSFYSLLCVVTGLGAITTLTTLQALACVVFGWVTLQLLQRIIGRPMVALGRRIERRVAGLELQRDWQGLAKLVDERTQGLEAVLDEDDL